MADIYGGRVLAGEDSEEDDEDEEGEYVFVPYYSTAFRAHLQPRLLRNEFPIPWFRVAIVLGSISLRNACNCSTISWRRQ